MMGIACRKHPSYKAKKKPTSGCHACKFMWQIKLFFVEKPFSEYLEVK